MEQFNNNFKFEDTYKKLSSLSLIDPQTAYISGEYFPINKQSARVLNSNLGLRSFQFSNQLFDHDKDLWETLRDKRVKTESVTEYMDNHLVMIINGLIVSVIDNDKYLSKFMSIIDEYIKDQNLQFYYNYKDDEFQFIALKEEVDNVRVGIIIRYYLSYNWITVSNILYDKNNSIYVSNNPITDKEIEDDLEMILDKSVLLGTCDLIIDEYTDFLRRSIDSKISFNELFNYLKSDFGLKIKYAKIDPIDFLANKEYSSEVSAFINDVLNYIYDTDAYKNVNASWLKKSIQFSKYSFNQYYKILSSMYMDNQANLSRLTTLINQVMTSNTNFIQINS